MGTALLLAAGKGNTSSGGGGGSAFNIDVNAATKTAPNIPNWTDGAFPADVQPAPLWITAQSPVYVEVAFASAGTYTVTGDGPTNSNIGTIKMYDQVTSTGTGTPAGSQGAAQNFNTGSPGGKYGAAFGSLVIAAPGTYRLWFAFSLNTYYGLKRLYFTP